MGNIQRVEALLERGVEVNTTGLPSSKDTSTVLSGTTGLMMAAMSGQIEVGKYFALHI